MSISGSGKVAARSIAETLHSSRSGVSKMNSFKIPSRPTSAISRPESALEAVFSPYSTKRDSPSRADSRASPAAAASRLGFTSPTPPSRNMPPAADVNQVSEQDPFDAAIASLAADFPLPEVKPFLASPLDSMDPLFLTEWSWHKTLNRSHAQFISQLKKHLDITDSEAENICENIHDVVTGLRFGKYLWNVVSEQLPAAEEESILSSLAHVLEDAWCPKLLAVWRCALVNLPRKM